MYSVQERNKKNSDFRVTSYLCESKKKEKLEIYRQKWQNQQGQGLLRCWGGHHYHRDGEINESTIQQPEVKGKCTAKKRLLKACTKIKNSISKIAN